MTSRSFLALSLSLPLVFGVAGLILRIKAMPFTASLIFGGIPYVPFAVMTAYLIKRCASMRNLVILTLAAPPAFAVWLAAIVIALNTGGSETFEQALGASAMFAVYALIFGYFYVVVAWGLWAGARWMRFVHNEFAT